MQCVRLAFAFVLAAAPVWAAPPSAITSDLFASARSAASALSILDEAALAQSASGAVRAFARRDLADQAAVAAALDRWAADQRQQDAAEATAPTIDHLGPLLYQLNGGAAGDRIPGAGLTQADHDSLAAVVALRGRAFDDAYIARTAATLRRIAGLYTDYIKNGDDPALVAISVHQGPRMHRLLSHLPHK